MATSTYGTPYVASSDLVSGYPTVSSSLATRIDEVSYKDNGINAQTGTTYTMVLTDAGKVVTRSNASASTHTIPLNSSVAYATGTWSEVLNLGAGAVTITATGGVTLAGTVTVPQYGRVRLTKTGTDTWYSSAMDTAVGGGLIYVTSATFSGASSFSVNNCFTSAYDNYRVTIQVDTVVTAGVEFNLRLRAAAADNTTSNYGMGMLQASANSASATNSATQTNARIGALQATAQPQVFTLDIFAPQLAKITTGNYDNARASGTTVIIERGGFVFNATTQFDGFSCASNAFAGTNITGTVKVYAYKN